MATGMKSGVDRIENVVLENGKITATFDLHQTVVDQTRQLCICGGESGDLPL